MDDSVNSMNSPDFIMAGSYDYRVVALSVLISILAAYASREFIHRVRDARRSIWLAWLVGGATVDGIGTWSMHYTGMLAFRLPTPVRYDLLTVLLSLLAGIIGSGGALFVLSHREVGWRRVFMASVFLGGIGISTLHYSAMTAMRFGGMHYHTPALATLAVIVAIAMCWVALASMFWFRTDTPGWRVINHLTALLRGLANPAMHYTAMAAAVFVASSQVPDWSHAVSISSLGIVGVSIVPLMVLVVALLTSTVDQIHNSRHQLRALGSRLEALREEERLHLAREIHDDLGQALTTLKMDLVWMEQKLTQLESAAINPILDRMVGATEATDGIVQKVQEIAVRLRPGVLDKLGLPAALQYECRRFQERTGVSCEWHVPESEPRLPGDVSTALFRIFQECLTNGARHAQATKVQTELRIEGAWVILSVSDNGRGITEAEIASPKSLGLLGMRERASLFGGEARFQRGPAGGTIVTVRIPAFL